MKSGKAVFSSEFSLYLEIYESCQKILTVKLKLTYFLTLKDVPICVAGLTVSDRIRLALEVKELLLKYLVRRSK